MNFVLAEFITKLVVASILLSASAIMSRRSTRLYMEDGDETESTSIDHSRQPKVVEGTAAILCDMDMKRTESASSHASSTTTSTSSSSGGSVEISTTVDVNHAFTHGLDHDLRFHASPLHRPHNFGLVVPGVYRSSYPKAEDFEFIQGLKLKTIVTLVHKDFPDAYRSFITKNGIQHHIFNMKGTKKEEIPLSTMNAILSIVMNKENYPLLIHCNHGKHRTGCVVAAVRKLAGWELSTILEEYKTYAAPKARECDVEYITKFQVASLSSILTQGTNVQGRSPGFLRATLLTIVVMVIFFISGKHLDPRQRPNNRREAEPIN